MSKSITRQMADDAAKKIANKAYGKKIENAKELLMKTICELLDRIYPKPVVALANEYPQYFKFGNCINIGYEGHYCIGFPVPEHTLILQNHYSNGLLVPIADYGKIEKLFSAWKGLQGKRLDYEHRVSNALIQLKSRKNVEANFPEALEFIDFGIVSLPSIRCEELRKEFYVK